MLRLIVLFLVLPGAYAQAAKSAPASQPAADPRSKLEFLHANGLALRFDVVDYRSPMWLPKNGWVPTSKLEAHIRQRFPSEGKGEPVVVTIAIVKARIDQGVLHATGDVVLRASIWRGGRVHEIAAEAQAPWRKTSNGSWFVRMDDLEPEIDVLELAMEDAMSDLAAQLDAWFAGGDSPALKHAHADSNDEDAAMIAIAEAHRLQQQQQMMHQP